ncbi:MAG TPA: hypothetical protein VMR52_05025 [Dehalococcoidia bacterium]|nr:hypothetical protein [Dehalococcoidia bacterium]
MVTRRTIRKDDGNRRITVIDDEDEPLDTHDEYSAHAGEREVVSSYPDGFSVARGFVRTFNMLIAFIALLVETVLAFRLGFALGGANPENGFVNFIYDVSAPLVAPFETIRNEEIVGAGVFEPETLIAMAVYAVAAFLIILFLSILTSAPRTGPVREVRTRERHAHIEEEEL